MSRRHARSRECADLWRKTRTIRHGLKKLPRTGVTIVQETNNGASEHLNITQHHIHHHHAQPFCSSLIRVIERLGVKIQRNTKLDTDIAFDEITVYSCLFDYCTYQRNLRLMLTTRPIFILPLFWSHQLPRPSFGPLTTSRVLTSLEQLCRHHQLLLAALALAELLLIPSMIL